MGQTEFVGDDAAERDPGTYSDLGVSEHRSSPDRVVLVETGNRDGWIAFDADAATTPDR
jgi:hypothetical protein